MRRDRREKVPALKSLAHPRQEQIPIPKLPNLQLSLPANGPREDPIIRSNKDIFPRSDRQSLAGTAHPRINNRHMNGPPRDKKKRRPQDERSRPHILWRDIMSNPNHPRRRTNRRNHTFERPGKPVARPEIRRKSDQWRASIFNPLSALSRLSAFGVNLHHSACSQQRNFPAKPNVVRRNSGANYLTQSLSAEAVVSMRLVSPINSLRQIGPSHQKAITLAGGSAAFVEGPDHQALTAPSVA